MAFIHQGEMTASLEAQRNVLALHRAHADLDGALGHLITLATQVQDMCHTADLPAGVEECFAQSFRSVVISILRCELLKESLTTLCVVSGADSPTISSTQASSER